ncbi:MAG: hypothetical protein ACR2IV_01465, partial [Bryobacteraceae bacterium]
TGSLRRGFPSSPSIKSDSANGLCPPSKGVQCRIASDTDLRLADTYPAGALPKCVRIANDAELIVVRKWPQNEADPSKGI